MTDRINRIVADIARTRQELNESLHAFPEEAFTLRPAPDEWSAGEVAAHLAVVENSVAAVLRRLLEHGKERGEKEEREEEGRKEDDVTLPPLPAERIDAPQRFIPENVLPKTAAVEALAASRRAILEAIDASRPFDLRGAIFPHRILGDLNFYQWILFVGAHERRHIGQIGTIRKRTDAAA